MDAEIVLRIGREALMLVLLLSAPLVITALVVGMTVSILQAATQVQEQTLSFVPKVVAVATAIAVFGPWILESLQRFASELISQIPTLVR